eukprot:2713881-Amphidinium_carterae.1
MITPQVLQPSSLICAEGSSSLPLDARDTHYAISQVGAVFKDSLHRLTITLRTRRTHHCRIVATRTCKPAASSMRAIMLSEVPARTAMPTWGDIS